MLKYVLAVLAAGANAASSVLQRKANRQASQREDLSLRLIWSLAHQPVWFGGVLAVIVGFLLHAIALGVNLAFVAALVAWGRRGPAGRDGGGGKSSALQAAVLAVAAGSTFGLTAALMKGMTNSYARGFSALFTSWQLYGMIAAGVLGMFLVQFAFNAGRLIAAQPGLTLSDPVVSILWGVLVFHEQ